MMSANWMVEMASKLGKMLIFPQEHGYGQSNMTLTMRCLDGVQFVQALLEANGLATGKDYQFKGRYEAEKNAVIISLEKDEREC